MATNLKLNDSLVVEALRIGGHKTKQAAVNAALNDYVNRFNRLRILELEGKISFRSDWDYKAERHKRR